MKRRDLFKFLPALAAIPFIPKIATNIIPRKWAENSQRFIALDCAPTGDCSAVWFIADGGKLYVYDAKQGKCKMTIAHTTTNEG